MNTKTTHTKALQLHAQTPARKLPLRSKAVQYRGHKRSAAKGQFAGRETSSQLPAKATDASSTPEEETAYQYTHLIEFLGVGTDEQQARYLVLQIGEQRMVMRVGNLTTNRGDELARLERAGVPLVAGPAQNEFILRTQEEAGKARL
jgi:hypothetical protein